MHQLQSTGYCQLTGAEKYFKIALGMAMAEIPIVDHRLKNIAQTLSALVHTHY